MKAISQDYCAPLDCILTRKKMGSVWSSYAGSSNIASFASEDRKEAKEYDYIICGGECKSDLSALGWGAYLPRRNCWMCNRQSSEMTASTLDVEFKLNYQLTENPDISVLVIEAGESDAKQIFSRVPAAWVGTQCTREFHASADTRSLSSLRRLQIGTLPRSLKRTSVVGRCISLEGRCLVDAARLVSSCNHRFDQVVDDIRCTDIPALRASRLRRCKSRLK